MNDTTNKGHVLGAAVGFAAGAGYAFYKKTGFWKGWGLAIIGSIVIGGLGYGIGYAMKKNPTNQPKQ